MSIRVLKVLSITLAVGLLFMSALYYMQQNPQKLYEPIRSISAEDTASVSSTFDRMETILPADMKGRAQDMGSMMLVSTSLDSACTLVTPTGGESLGTALKNAITSNASNPASFCIHPGVIDQDINLNGPVSLILYPGIYTQTKPITLSGVGAAIIGQNTGSSVLVYQSNVHGPNVSIASEASKFKVSGLTLSRTTQGTQDGDNGIRTAFASGKGVELGLLENLYISNQYDGMYLMVTNYTRVNNIVITDGKRTGILMTNSGSSSGPCQYYLKDVLLQLNDGYALYVSPDGGKMSVGNWDGILTWGNLTGGIYTGGSTAATAVQGVRLSNSFFGQDGYVGGNPEIWLYAGAMHNISNTFVEIGGYHPTANVAPHVDVAGITLGANVTSAQLTGVYVTNNSGSGMIIYGTNVMINASSFITNGGNTSNADYKTGILVAGTNSKVNVGVSQFVNNGAQQLIGIKSYSSNVPRYGVTFDTSGTTQGYVGP